MRARSLAAGRRPGAARPVVVPVSTGRASSRHRRRRDEAEHLLLQPRRPAGRRARATSTRCSSCRRPGSGWPTAALHAALRHRAVLLPVPVLADDRPLSAQQRRPPPVAGPDLRRAALDGLLPAGRRLLDVRRRASSSPPGRQTTTPPCFDHSTVMWGGYNNVAVRVDGVAQTMTGYSTTASASGAASTSPQALGLGKPFLLYETPQAPHWVDVTRPGRHRDAAGRARHQVRRRHRCGTCSGVRPRPTARDKPPYVRNTNCTTAQAQVMCAEPAAGDHDRRRRVRRDHAAAVRPGRAGQHPGDLLLGQRLHVGRPRADREVRARTSRRCACRCCVRWPGHIAAGTATRRGSSRYLDMLPTMLAAAACHGAGRRAASWTGSPCSARARRTTVYAEYFVGPREREGADLEDGAHRDREVHPDLRRPHGAVTFREYYNLGRRIRTRTPTSWRTATRPTTRRRPSCPRWPPG